MKRITLAIVFFNLILGLVIGSCEKDIEPEYFPSADVDFSYTATTLHYVIGEEIQFNNNSRLGSSWDWNFGDGITSNEQNPVHRYESPGTYTVTLKVDGIHEIRKKIMISDIVPVVSYTSTDPAIIYNQSQVSFEVLLENPEDKPIVFNWKFPGGTVGEGIDENGNSQAVSPTVVFGSIGSQNVSLSVNYDGKQLTPVNVNVRVNYNQPAKTLYYAVKGGNIMAKKLIYDIDPALNNPFDLGYRSGKHPLTLQFSGNWLYVFDAGTRFAFVNEPEYLTAGDGEIFVVAHDGSRRESVIENFGGDTFLDFYYGYIDEAEGLIYWADRREGIFRIPINTRNQKFSMSDYDYFVRNAWLGYYGQGISWGNINGTITKYNDTWWWAKHTNGSGIFRFTESDILGRDRVDGDPVPAAGRILGNFRIRSFVIDEMNQKIYFADNATKFIFRSNIDGTGLTVIDRAPFDGEGGVTEPLFVTGMATDGEYLYWAYRGPQPPAGTDPEVYYQVNPTHRSGIKRIKLTDEVPVIEYFIEGVEAYGIAIDQTPR